MSDSTTDTSAPTVADAEFLERQRARVFQALGILELVEKDVLDDSVRGDRCCGALGAARAQLQAAHDEIDCLVFDHMRKPVSE